MIRLQVYILSFLMLLVLYMQLVSKDEAYFLPHRLLKAMILSTMFAICMEAFSWVFDGRAGQTARVLVTASNTLLLTFNILPLVAWTLFIDFRIHGDMRRIKRSAIPLVSFAAVNALFALTAPLNGLYFYLDNNNFYHRGVLAPAVITIDIALFIYSVLLLIANWRVMKQRGRTPLFLSLLPPLAGLYLQAKYYGVGLVWAGVSLSILIICTATQNQTIKTDYLTGLNNRRQLDRYLENRIRNPQRKQLLAGIMIDIDNFKQINDAHGHLTGDRALEATALALRRYFLNDFVARYAGDEFVVLLELDDTECLEAKVTGFALLLAEHCAVEKEPFRLQISTGYAVYGPERQSADQFLDQLDQLMYEQKLSKRV